MSVSQYPVPMKATRASTGVPVPFGHRNVPAMFAGGTLISQREPREDLRFAGRVTRSNRFPVEAALAMNEVRVGRMGHHVDTRC